MSQYVALTCNYKAFHGSQLNEHETILNDFYNLVIVLIKSVNEKLI